MSKIDKKNKKGQKKQPQKPQKKAFEQKNKQVSKASEKNKGENQPSNKNDNDKLNEQILALGGTKGDLKYLESIDVDTSDELVTNKAAKDEVKHRIN
jgi:ribosome biogenesis protein MAK21